MEIRTARLVLRRAVPADVGGMYEILSSPEAMRFWSTLPHESMAVTEAWFEEQFFSGKPERDEWIIAHNGRVIGNVGIWNMPEFGFILHPDAWGKGFATEAARAFIDYAFATHPIEDITADVDPDNAASLKVMKKLGFAETRRAERTFLIGGKWFDSVYLSLPRPR